MIFRVSSHTDYLGSGSTYVAIAGKDYNGIDFIEQAIARGATKIVVQKDQLISTTVKKQCQQRAIEIIVVDDARRALAEYAARAYDYPARKLKIFAVTGTDGKTTSTYLLYHMLKAANKKVALLSGVQNIIADQIFPVNLTTAKPDFLHYFFDQCVQTGIEYVAMEVSAQAASLHRIDGIQFAGGIFTNLAHEHGECYADLQKYFQAKSIIFGQFVQKAPLVVHEHEWAHKVRERFADVMSCGFSQEANCQIVCLQETLHRQIIEFHWDGEWHVFESQLVGPYNALNIGGAALLACRIGIPVDAVKRAIKIFTGAKGRFERYPLPNGSLAIIDYAHTPQAYLALLNRLRRYARRLIVVFGAAGGKDIAKRPIMGKIAAQYCDFVVLTNDNPRHEDPAVIMSQVMANLSLDERASVVCEPDRERAIAQAYALAGAGDIIAILGKGGETVQIVGKQRLAYSDERVVRGLM
jgi:UDP-N-acetylmuramoyl-L-alanyl-D-glutamate--2,6-diaminopimelate ligase